LSPKLNNSTPSKPPDPTQLNPKPIVVIGGINQDMVVSVAELPLPGETVFGNSLLLRTGGKGANQAVAATALGGHGGRVYLAGKVGDDSTGHQIVGQLADRGVNTSMVTVEPGKSTGIAMILVDRNGENIIAVAQGANSEVDGDQIDTAADVLGEAGGVAVVQFELPLETAVAATQRFGNMDGVTTLINPSPVPSIPVEQLKGADVLVVNEVEAEEIVGIGHHIESHSQALDVARQIAAHGIGTVIITLGRLGAIMYSGTSSSSQHNGTTGEYSIAARPPAVKVVDTTGAGDAFMGGLAAGISKGWTMEESFGFAMRAGAMATTKMGAQEALPYVVDANDFTNHLPLVIFNPATESNTTLNEVHINA